MAVMLDHPPWQSLYTARVHDKTREEEERVTPIDAHTHGQNIFHVLKIERLKASLVESVLLDL